MSRVVVGTMAAMALSGVLVVGAPGPAQAEPDGDPCGDVNQFDREDKTPATKPSAPLDKLQIQDAQDLVRRRTANGTEPGTGVQVAVVDSGVFSDQSTSKTPKIAVSGRSRAGQFAYYHGTAMAGIIAGRAQDEVGLIGIAPGATIYDARFYDSTTPDREADPPQEGPNVENLVETLTALAPLTGRTPDKIRIVNVSIAVKEDIPTLKKAVDAITATGAIVVASSGNRVSETDPSSNDDNAYDPGEDVTQFPAGYAATNPLVVSVGTTTDAEFEKVENPSGLLSSSIDVVVPTFGSVSYTIDGETCSFYQSSTSVAAAEVSGILALLAAAFPDDTPEQLIARLETTATGDGPSVGGMVDKYQGRGIVQPLEALTRPLRPDVDGVIQPSEQQPPPATPVALPESQPDVLRSTRRAAVWWGLFGGGALVVALLLRPVLSRRRTPRGQG